MIEKRVDEEERYLVRDDERGEISHYVGLVRLFHQKNFEIYEKKRERESLRASSTC